MAPQIDEFDALLEEDDRRQFGRLLAVFPKEDFGRTALSQFGIGAVGCVMATVCLVVSFSVVVSNAPDEQLPFQQAMWGFAAVSGMLGVYGMSTGGWRSLNGLARVGRWWLLFERGLVIVNHGRVEHRSSLGDLRVQSASRPSEKMKLLTANGRALPLPLRAENATVTAVQERQRELLRTSAEGAPAAAPLRYVLGWSAAQLFGEDRVYRIYPSERGLLVIYAGPFVPSKLGVKLPAAPAQGALAHLGNAYADWTGGSAFDERRKYLDAMTHAELENEARQNKVSAVLDADNTTDVSIEPPASGIWSNPTIERRLAGRVSFRHQNRHWQLAVVDRAELEFVTNALRQLFGPERVKIVQPEPEDEAIKDAKTLAYCVNGCGTAIFDAGGLLRWDREESRDGVLCVCLLAMPVIPLKVLHTFGERGSIRGTTFRWLPLRWSPRLILYAFLNQYLNLIGLVAFAATFVGGMGLWLFLTDPKRPAMPAAWASFAILGVALGWPIFFGGWWAALRVDRRNRRIRRVLGFHEQGNSDPVTWPRRTLAAIGTPDSRYQSSTWSLAAQRLLREGDYVRAMFAARLCAAAEDRREGERLTTEILGLPRVQQFLQVCEASSSCEVNELHASLAGRGDNQDEASGSDPVSVNDSRPQS